MQLLRRWLSVMAVVGSLGAFVPVASAAQVAPGDEGMWRAFRGKLVFSDVALAPDSFFESAAMKTSALRRIQRTTVDERAGFWRVHVLAFLERPSATGTLVLRATNVTDPNSPRAVRVFEVPVQRGDKELRLDDFVVTSAMGFTAGESYEFTLEAPADEGGPGGAGPEQKKAGKADAYAKGVITLR